MEAPNGRIGLYMYRQRPTDLVITDILMPEMNGLDMLRRVNSSTPRSSRYQGE